MCWSVYVIFTFLNISSEWIQIIILQLIIRRLFNISWYLDKIEITILIAQLCCYLELPTKYCPQKILEKISSTFFARATFFILIHSYFIQPVMLHPQCIILQNCDIWKFSRKISRSTVVLERMLVSLYLYI